MTSVEEIAGLVDQYRSWVKDRTTLKSVHEDWVEITTPFIDRHNDYVQLYAKREDRGFRLTDDGHTIRDLELSGCVLDTPKRQELLRLALNGFAVEEKNGSLSVKATTDNFAVRKHSLVQAILAVNDLFYTSGSIVRSLFKEDVARWLDLSEVRYLPDVQFTGKSGYTHHFDFAIPRSRLEPERILKAINNPNKDAAQSLIFSWLDTRDERPPESRAVAFLNDNERVVTSAVIDALQHYEIQPVLWSRRDEVRPKLVA